MKSNAGQWVVVLMALGLAHGTACKEAQIAFVPQSEDMAPDSEVRPDASGSACVTPCEGGTPVCDEAAGVCVACLTASECRDDLPHTASSCEQGTCVYQCDQTMEPWQVIDGQLIEEQGCTCVPSEELCDGQDNDCDGEVDELPSLACALTVGVCAQSSVSCEGDAATYTDQCDADFYGAHATARGERYDADTFESLLCDGQDNDCDGATDEACCAAGSPAKPVRVANTSLPGTASLLAASAASPNAGHHVVAYLQDEQTVRVVEYDQHLREVAHGTQSFSGKRVKVFEAMTTLTGYMFVVGLHQESDPAAPGAELSTLSFYELDAVDLTPAGSVTLFANTQTHKPFSMITPGNRVTKLRMTNDGAQIMFVMETAHNQDHGLTTCSTSFQKIAERSDYCIARRLLEPDLTAFWRNNVMISDDARPHELVLARREDRVALYWAPASSDLSLDTTQVIITRLDGLDWKTFDISHTEGYTYGYRSAPHLLQWTGEDELAFIYHNADIQTFSYLARIKADAALTDVNAEQLPAIGSKDRYLGVGMLDEGRDGSLDELAFVYRGSAVGDERALGLLTRASAQPTTIQGTPVLLTSQRDKIDDRILTRPSPFGLIALIPYSSAGELELVEVTHEGDRVCRP